MDVSFFKNRGKAWMGDIYQKVEGMIQEVDGVIKQDRKNPTADRGKTSKISVDGFFSEVIQGLHIINPSESNQKNTTPVKSPVKVEDRSYFINTDQSRLRPTITPKDNLGDKLKSDDNTVGIHNLVLDVEDKPKLVISEKSDLKAPIYSGIFPDHNKVIEADVVNKPGVLSESVEDEDRKPISEEPINSGLTREMDMIDDESFMSNKYDEVVTNHFSVEPDEVKVEPELFPFNEVRFDASVNLLDDNVKVVHGSESSEGTEDHTYQNVNAVYDQFLEETEEHTHQNVNAVYDQFLEETEDHTYQNVNAVYDQFLEETEGLVIPESETGTKSLTDHQDDNAANLMHDISPMALSSPSGPNAENISEDSEKIPGFQSKNLQIQVPSDKPVDDLTELGMETIDLHDEAAMEESSSVIDAKELYAVSQRVQKLRSFREKIQDAFTAKRRLAKEYEQLSIWYGDIDFDGSSRYKPQDRPARSIAVSDAQNGQKHQSSDSEWVML